MHGISIAWLASWAKDPFPSSLPFDLDEVRGLDASSETRRHPSHGGLHQSGTLPGGLSFAQARVLS